VFAFMGYFSGTFLIKGVIVWNIRGV